MQEPRTRAVVCMHCQAESTEAHHERIVHNRMPLYGPWAGWRMAGRELGSPDGDRITPRRLAGVLWAENSRKRILKAQQRPAPTPQAKPPAARIVHRQRVASIFTAAATPGYLQAS